MVRFQTHGALVRFQNSETFQSVADLPHAQTRSPKAAVSPRKLSRWNVHLKKLMSRTSLSLSKPYRNALNKSFTVAAILDHASVLLLKSSVPRCFTFKNCDREWAFDSFNFKFQLSFGILNDLNNVSKWWDCLTNGIQRSSKFGMPKTTCVNIFQKEVHPSS